MGDRVMAKCRADRMAGRSTYMVRPRACAPSRQGRLGQPALYNGVVTDHVDGAGEFCVTSKIPPRPRTRGKPARAVGARVPSSLDAPKLT